MADEKTHMGIDWGIGEAQTVHFFVDPKTGRKRALSQAQYDELIEKELQREYVALERHRRATMMIDYRVATTRGPGRQLWLKMQRQHALKVYQ